MRKNFEVIDTVYVDEDENIVLEPGDIVEIELDKTPNDFPCLIINDEMYDIAFDSDEEFNEFFREVHLKEGEAIEFVSKEINVKDMNTTIEVVEMRLNTGEYIIVLIDNKKLDWRVSKKSIVDEFKDIEHDEIITWPESEYIENKEEYSKVVKSELEKYLVLSEEEGWGWVN